MPLVSVVISTYKRTQLLRQTLDSVLAQTFTDFEIIVVDDGTPGKENELLCQEFPQLTYFKIENSGGPSRPRNFGINKATGKYIAILDDDDLWLPQKLEKQVALLERNPEFGIVHTPCTVIDSKGVETGDTIGKPRDVLLKHGDVSMKMIGRWTLMTSSVLFRKSLLTQVGFFNETMPQAGEDMHFWTRCSFYTKFYYYPEPLVLYREHQGISKQFKEKYFELPWHLHEILKGLLKEGHITAVQYSLLRNNIIRMQLKELSEKRGETIKRLFAFNPFWFLNFENGKIFLRNLFKRIN
ncbi:MAG: glycosyltransferase family A protein [Flavobacteriaceae bacterium]